MATPAPSISALVNSIAIYSVAQVKTLVTLDSAFLASPVFCLQNISQIWQPLTTVTPTPSGQALSLAGVSGCPPGLSHPLLLTSQQPEWYFYIIKEMVTLSYWKPSSGFQMNLELKADSHPWPIDQHLAGTATWAQHSNLTSTSPHSLGSLLIAARAVLFFPGMLLLRSLHSHFLSTCRYQLRCYFPDHLCHSSNHSQPHHPALFLHSIITIRKFLLLSLT